jgi:AcrR family transcriptional regulator
MPPPGKRTPATRMVSEKARPAPSANGLGREQVTQIQRARMLTAMSDVVSEYGAANVTVAHVVSRAGVSRRTFYEVFEDREDCLLAALDDAIGCAAEYVLPVYETPGGWRDRVRASLTALLEFLDAEPAAGRLLIVESLGAGPVALEHRRRVLERIVAAVDEGRREIKNGRQPPPLTAEGVVGGVLSLLHNRLVGREHGSLPACPPPVMGGSPRMGELAGPLMGIIVLPYLGSTAAQKEVERPVPHPAGRKRPGSADPLRDLGMRLTYRTVRALVAVAEHPGSSNREVGVASGIGDQGQISKLLSRLHRLGLIHNTGVGPTKGAPNAWTLTGKGTEVEQAIGQQAGGQGR